jgi:hypothetical protein
MLKYSQSFRFLRSESDAFCYKKRKLYILIISERYSFNKKLDSSLLNNIHEVDLRILIIQCFLAKEEKDSTLRILLNNGYLSLLLYGWSWH